MSAATRTVLACAWLLTLVAANWRSTDGGDLGPQDPRARAFSHRSHVPAVWLDADVPEVWRDCRGCHRFSADQTVSSPQQHCRQCHGETLVPDFRGRSQQTLADFASRTREAFRHHTHATLECRECHGIDGFGIVTGSIPIRTGPGECARCHESFQAPRAAARFDYFAPAFDDEEVARQIGLDGKAQKPQDLAAFAVRLDRVFAGEGSGINALLTAGGDFTHGDHLNLELTCESCHASIKAASPAEVGTSQINVAGCGECHQRSAGEEARFSDERNSKKRESYSLGAFSHADHYRAGRKDGVCDPKAYELIEQRSCQHCHDYQPERAGFDGRDFPFDGNSSKHRYQDCAECHSVAGWTTGEVPGDAQRALHGSAPDRPSAWGADGKRCTACHEFGGPDMAGTRPQASVERWSGTSFAFRGQTHPFLTVSQRDHTPGVQQDCSKCHRAVVPELPTRLIEKTFRHATHLPRLAEGQTYAAESCTSCHPSAARTDSSQSLGADYRTYDLKACSDCHYGQPVREQVAADQRPEPRTVVEFPHGPHVAKLSCVECHDYGTEDMTTKPAALACNECHNHVSGDDGPRTEYLFDEQVQSCSKCHRGGDPELVSVPPLRGSDAAASDPRYGIDQQLFAGFRDAQFHPSSSSCADCHRADVEERTIDGTSRKVVQPIEIAQGTRKRTVRNFVFAAIDGRYHEDVKAKADYQIAECYDCHWAQRSISEEQPAKPESPATRRQFGNRFASYPGGK